MQTLSTCSACLLHTIPHQSHLNNPGINTQSPQTVYKKKIWYTLTQPRVHAYMAVYTAARQPLIDKQYINVVCTPARRPFSYWRIGFTVPGKNKGAADGRKPHCIRHSPVFLA